MTLLFLHLCFVSNVRFSSKFNVVTHSEYVPLLTEVSTLFMCCGCYRIMCGLSVTLYYCFKDGYRML